MKRRRLAAGIAVATVLAVAAFTLLAGPRGDAVLGGVGQIPNLVQRGPDRDVPCVEKQGAKPACATPSPG
jgi:predicted RecA/RadA family phage recombinase